MRRAPDSSHADPAEVRLRYLKHEAAVRSIGSLYLLSFFTIPVAIYLFAIGAANELLDAGELGFVVPLIVICLGLSGMLYGWLGVKLRQLSPKVRIPTACLTIPGLLQFPLGTLLSIYILWLLLSDKGAFVMSEEYAAVRRATPEIRYKTPVVLRVLGWLLLAFVVVGGGFALAGLARISG